MSVSRLSEELAANGHQVEVYATAANGASELDVQLNEPVNVDGVKVTYFKRLTKDHTHYSPGLLKAVRKTVKNFDVMHVHAWWNAPSMFSCYYALKAGVPVVLSPRGTLSAYSFNHRRGNFKALFHRFFAARLLKKCLIHATSAMEAKAMTALTGARQVVTIPNFVKLPAGVPTKAPYDGSLLKLLFFSRIDRKKRLDTLIRALPGINLPWRLTVAGNAEPGYLEELKQISVDNGTADRINWVGFQSENKFDIMAAHHLLILPSHDENFANVVIESLSAGTAVVVSKTVGLADYVAEKDFGAVCDADEQSLSQCIHNLGADIKKINRIAETAPGIIREDFDDRKLLARYEEMYRVAKNQNLK